MNWLASSACIPRRSANGNGSCSTAPLELFSGDQRRKVENQDALIAELYEQIGRLQMEAAWLKKKVARLD